MTSPDPVGADVDGVTRDEERHVALLVHPDPARLEGIAAELREGLGETVTVVRASDASAAEEAAASLEGRLVLVVTGDRLPDRSGAELLDRIHAQARHRAARKLLVTDRRELAGLSGAVTRGAVHGVVAIPWTPGQLGLHLRTQVLRALERDAAGAGAVAELAVAAAPTSRSGILAHLDVDEDELEGQTIAALDEALGHRPRLVLEPDTVLIREEETVDGLWLLLSGDVTLSRRTGDDETLLHQRSTGPVLGLLSLTQQRRAFVTCRARTEVVAVHLTVEQLDQALRSSPTLPPLFLAVLLRALAGRLRRSEILHLENAALHRQVADERDRLAEALATLEAAEMQLVESARMATLGELAAGLAHELNNPVAALQRTAAHVTEDTRQLLGPELAAAFDAAVAEPARSTAETRALRRRLAEVVGDRRLADRLVAAGVTDADAARRFAQRPPPERDRLLDQLELTRSLATSLRNIDSAAGRVAGLVHSLRAYAREGMTEGDGVDVNEGLEDSLRLVGHRLTDVEVERRYGAVPAVPGDAGALNQVWTNLLTNALDAMDDAGRLTVTTDRPDDDHVRVRIADSGPGLGGIDPRKLFEPRFTTRGGRVSFGLGMGLAISRRIVHDHGGSIEITSDSGGATATVVLPAHRQDPT